MDKKERIILAALEEFVERGFAGARIRNICQTAKVNLAAVSYYFGGKESLYKAVLNYSFSLPDPFEAAKTDLDNAVPPETALLNWLTQFLKHTETSGSLYRYRYRLIVREMLTPSEFFPELFTKGLGARFEILKQVIAKVHGKTKDERELTMTSLLVLAQCLFFFNKPVLSSITGDVDFGANQAADIAALIVKGIKLQADYNGDL